MVLTVKKAGDPHKPPEVKNKPTSKHFKDDLAGVDHSEKKKKKKNKRCLSPGLQTAPMP